MNDYAQESIKIFSKVKNQFKEHCTTQFFCGKCAYNMKTGNKIDCFEKFYVLNFSKIADNIDSNKTIFE